MQTNKELELAWRYIEETGCHIFLTGKAGTGKTTFLKQLSQRSSKRMIVVAPTGVAAINAGGVTIHSFFQLPFGPYLPGVTMQESENRLTRKFSKEKINIIRSIDLLVIDEISMVRADLLDHINEVLCRYGDHHKAFGGVQLLMIGDLQQLAPVVNDNDRQLLEKYYDTNYFFGSHVLKQAGYVTIELKTVYRQSDLSFVSLLNEIRSGTATDETLADLNQRYLPHFNPKEEEGYITLTTHNLQAQRINQQHLDEMSTPAYSFRSRVEGDFPENLYPTEQKLVLKEGAQVMFIKNDTETPRRYYNGKIGKVVRLTASRIEVLCSDWDSPLVLEQAKWEHTQYSLNSKTNEIEGKVCGTFLHYPIKTAWAITIHKSQGLTFEHVIINAASSFAHGQVYVALSRCRTLEGMVLSEPIDRSALIDDSTISEFSEKIEAMEHTPEELTKYSNEYIYSLLTDLFDFNPFGEALQQMERLVDEFFYRDYPALLKNLKAFVKVFKEEVFAVSVSFRGQYSTLFHAIYNEGKTDQESILQERIKAAATYFHQKIRPFVSLQNTLSLLDKDNKVIAKRLANIQLELFSQFILKETLLRYAQKEGFSLDSYLKVRAEALVLKDEKKKPRERPQRSLKSIFDESIEPENILEETNSKKTEVTLGIDFDKPLTFDDIPHLNVYEKLKKWRNATAKQRNLPVYTIIQTKAMIGIAKKLPLTLDELKGIPYFGEKGLENYGEEILQIVKKEV